MLKIAVAKETKQPESRVALTPETTKTLAKAGFSCVVESGAGDAAGFRDALYEKLKMNYIFTRRYFYPLISNFPTYRVLPSADPANLPIANSIAEKVLCLPIYPGLDDSDIKRICRLIEER